MIKTPPADRIVESTASAVKNARGVVHQGWHILRSEFAIVLLAFWLILITIPLVNGLIIAVINWLSNGSIFAAERHTARLVFGILTSVLTYFYTVLVTAYFTCAMSAAVLAELDGHPEPAKQALRLVLKKFWRIFPFAILAGLYVLPFVSVWSQKDKLPKRIVEVLGSSISVNVALLSPGILHHHEGLLATVRHSVDTLGKAWKENLVLRVWTYGLIILLGTVGFLPKLIEHYWFNGSTSHIVGWLASTLLVLTLWVTAKIISGLYTTILYWRVTNKKL